jgi:hypothetical protein
MATPCSKGTAPSHRDEQWLPSRPEKAGRKPFMLGRKSAADPDAVWTVAKALRPKIEPACIARARKFRPRRAQSWPHVQRSIMQP